jgi:predicted O-methyltransferase YrrM
MVDLERSPLDRTAKLVAMMLCRMVGAHRTADQLYARRLEGYLSTPKVRLLYRVASSLAGPGAIAEIGSWKGKSTVTLGLAVLRAGRKDTIYAIDHHAGVAEDTGSDTWTPQGSTWPEFLETIREAGVAEIVHPLKMDSPAGARWLAEKSVQLKLLLVDGAHDEESVTDDLHGYFPLVLPGGLVALDDARPDGACPGVYRAYQKVIEAKTSPVEWAGSLFLVRKNFSA